ncbi:hypothetical protein D3C74_344660 [compost metagenome]
MVVNSPSQSCAPTVMSGPLPVGTCARKSARMSSKFLRTTSTLVPFSASKAFAASVTAAWRVSSTQTVSAPVEPVESPDPEVVSSSPLPPPEQAVSSSVVLSAAARRMLRRI